MNEVNYLECRKLVLEDFKNSNTSKLESIKKAVINNSNPQNEIQQWVIDNGGQATVVPKTAIRFDKEKLKELLEINETIDQINCN